MQVELKMDFAWLSSRFRTHPREEDLLAYRDAELPPREHARVGRHLKGCASCQAALASFEMDIRTFEAIAEGTNAGECRVDFGILQLQDAVNERAAGRRTAQSPDYWFELPEDMLGRVCAELEIYLGPHAARKFIARARATACSSQELIGAVEPLMGGLLGTETGTAVANRVALLCGSARVSTPPSLNQ